MVFWFENIDQAQAWFVSDIDFETIQIFIDDDFQQKTISAVGNRFQQTREFIVANLAFSECIVAQGKFLDIWVKWIGIFSFLS